ncbi:hypothetical protein BV22DRAFT_508067 [Leucogyrophana mollusca]|uniref:Uncharacterized protein n=1 Tax=Leucogyrophana mollusca TaxID=85980 RepID=A0ACB8BG35_9AGAM|nr:hypothetical protein BV22DRAFT_508067 [Leucogyrophana mollusca]
MKSEASLHILGSNNLSPKQIPQRSFSDPGVGTGAPTEKAFPSQQEHSASGKKRAVVEALWKKLLGREKGSRADMEVAKLLRDALDIVSSQTEGIYQKLHALADAWDT